MSTKHRVAATMSFHYRSYTMRHERTPATHPERTPMGEGSTSWQNWQSSWAAFLGISLVQTAIVVGASTTVSTWLRRRQEPKTPSSTSSNATISQPQRLCAQIDRAVRPLATSISRGFQRLWTSTLHLMPAHRQEGCCCCHVGIIPPLVGICTSHWPSLVLWLFLTRSTPNLRVCPWPWSSLLLVWCGQQILLDYQTGPKDANDNDNRNSMVPRSNRRVPARPSGNQDQTSSSTGTSLLQDVASSEQMHRVEQATNRKEKESSQQYQRYMELLVHNVSHTDLVLSLESTKAVEKAPSLDQSFVDVGLDDIPGQNQERQAPASTQGEFSGPGEQDFGPDDDPYCLCRPRFSRFDKYSRLVLEQLQTSDESKPEDQVLYFRRHQRTDSRRLYVNNPPQLEPTATGIQLQKPVEEVDLQDLRIRGRDQCKVIGCSASPVHQHQSHPESEKDTSVRIRHVFFPLLATLLPRWREQIEAKEYSHAPKRVLMLVSGVGAPRNWTHDARENSTEACAQLMKYFLKLIDPELIVVHIHSETNLFRYDENLVFVEQELMPAIHSYRDAHARQLPYPDELQGSMEGNQVLQGMTTTGTSLRSHPFSPDWRTTFHTTLSFADGSPARTYAIQASLRPYRPTYYHFHQLKTFWHEAKIVNDDIEVRSFEEMETIPAVDTNRCSDPNVIKVIEEMKSFRRQMIQTLLSDNDILRFWLRKTHKPVLSVLLVQSADMDEPVLYRGTNMEVSMPTGSLCAERNVIGSALADYPALKREDLKLIAVLAVPLVEVETIMKRSTSSGSFGSLINDRKLSIGSEGDQGDPPPDGQGSNAPLRRVALFSKTSQDQRTVVLQSTSDLNPLRP